MTCRLALARCRVARMEGEERMTKSMGGEMTVLYASPHQMSKAMVGAMDLAERARAFTTVTITVVPTRELVAVKDERDRLAAELAEVMEYAGHKNWCALPEGFTKCTCGWAAMRERYAKGRTT